MKWRSRVLGDLCGLLSKLSMKLSPQMLTRSEMCVLCVKYYSFLGLLHCPTWLQLTRRKHFGCVWERAEKAGAFLVNENLKWQTSGMWWDLNTGYQDSSSLGIWKQLANRVYSHMTNPRGSSYKGMDLKNQRKCMYRDVFHRNQDGPELNGLAWIRAWNCWPYLRFSYLLFLAIA